MYRKLFVSFLLVALINLTTGCYSSEWVTVTDSNQVWEDDEFVGIKTEEFQEYHVSKGYYVENDTLYWIQRMQELPFEGQFSLSEIESIQFKDFRSSIHNSYTVSEYQKIESSSGKPEKIYLTKTDHAKYYFMKSNYHIENDTLYGSGSLILDSDSERQVDKKIALSDIESVQVEYIDGLATVGLVLGIAAVSFVGLASLVTFK